MDYFHSNQSCGILNFWKYDCFKSSESLQNSDFFTPPPYHYKKVLSRCLVFFGIFGNQINAQWYWLGVRVDMSYSCIDCQTTYDRKDHCGLEYQAQKQYNLVWGRQGESISLSTLDVLMRYCRDFTPNGWDHRLQPNILITAVLP